MLLTGATGQLGSAFRRLLYDATPVGRHAVDLARPASVRQYLETHRPGGIVNCAGYTDVDGAEAEEDLATVINGESVGVMASYAAEARVPFVTFSTDYVFDGAASEPYVESDLTRPISAYGRSKLAGEQAALEANPNSLVVRTAWLMSATHPNFVSAMVGLAREGKALRVVADQTGSPTHVEDLAAATVAALGVGADGVLHLSNAGSATRFQLAQAALRLAGFDPEIVEPIATSELPTPAARPAYTALASERLKALGLAPLPPWEESLVRIVAALEATA